MKTLATALAVFTALAIGVAIVLSPPPEAAPQCVDPTLCPIVVCPPDWTFVDTTCKECQHCEPPDSPKGKGKGQSAPLRAVPGAEEPIDLPAQLLELGIEGEVKLLEPHLLELEATPAGKGKKPRCQGCSITLGDSCERVSCNPCCYSCPGLPYLVCTS